MDTCNWFEDRSNEIKETSEFIKKVGYSPKSVAFVPISGWHGDNMIEATANMPWYKGWEKDTMAGTSAAPLSSSEDAYKIGGIGTIPRRPRRDRYHQDRYGCHLRSLLAELTEHAVQLKNAGLTAYHHNVDTSREYFDKLVTSRTYDDHISTISAVRESSDLAKKPINDRSEFPPLSPWCDRPAPHLGFVPVTVPGGLLPTSGLPGVPDVLPTSGLPSVTVPGGVLPTTGPPGVTDIIPTTGLPGVTDIIPTGVPWVTLPGVTDTLSGTDLPGVTDIILTGLPFGYAPWRRWNNLVRRRSSLLSTWSASYSPQFTKFELSALLPLCPTNHVHHM
ncbi:hypothetical protein A4X13_0g7894 [Tilletia indica]|uniref:Uncharacterized protein n=1 Tax=Tilletia indica TaxID=43049 RepID=A0A8T8SHF8_9BASI|nr:hypothetical protein A4X13_0g7894 [Tilletia indica]